MSERLQDIELRLLLEGIFLRYSHDFRNYSKASLKRRVLQALTRFDCPSISALQERVLHDPALFAELLQFITIPVSEKAKPRKVAVQAAGSSRTIAASESDEPQPIDQ